VKNISRFGEPIESIIDDIKKTIGDGKLYVAFSGGLDSSVVAALAKIALGPERVELVTTKFDFTYPQSVNIIEQFTSMMGLKHVYVDGSEWQRKIWKKGPACNACTKGPKLQSVKKYSKGLVATGAELGDTWGQQGIKVNDGLYSPLSSLSRLEIEQIANVLEIKIQKIGENAGREGCMLKHLLKMMTSFEFHGYAVYESNRILMDLVESNGLTFSIANVKIIGPLSSNIALVNLWPEPSYEFKAMVKNELSKISQIDRTDFVDAPIELKITANSGIYNDEKARYWIENGRLKPDFARPISIEWKSSKNKRLSTFAVVDYQKVKL
jgi:uncharacterized protein